jgi:hypothetical protein
MAKTPAWTRKEGKNPKGGLNAKGRASYKGGTLKAPVKKGDNPRRASFLARMGGMRGPEKILKESLRDCYSLFVHGVRVVRQMLKEKLLQLVRRNKGKKK